MKFKETSFTGLYLIEPDIFRDVRGYFMETFNQETFKKAGIPFTPVQDNESMSVKGVIRGLHYQLRPFEQAKLVRVAHGKIFDVALDLRKNSKTYGKWYGIEIDSESKKQLFIPRGFAHGFSVLSETAVVQYKCDNFYRPSSERGILVTDTVLGIDWKINPAEAIISEKDNKNPHFKDAENNF
ncbi:MAG TPA: dTDP-4-dehydrorhamnose 3,5-epimerase [Bacteroidales bacterium]|nr:dTDP-4-dehydrorhamnose 3,5-epimerase [Bacteroidales bacterium]HOU95273.1 dTDP-4-dehydrorhamnose 3,5-epimerase [Bacteroidales bacterium]HQG35609.1 dTDP-4-dehydrorhamnose 3,5-epimerase [Bacteroidales bacterium]HQG51919.1 dTDP-4-dehydrorhamnose 3,5-epimerase [Bacteroidales bacterium]HQJ19614.1 dTDP-4-dehydrorhamnose 3,5-epimerase [Bacteroidales bacterium]